MHCKNYRAYTMAEAMAAVKADLGADAIVLHTRTLTQGGFLGIGRKTVIEITAARGEDAKRSSLAPTESPNRAERDAVAAALIGPRTTPTGGAAQRAYGSTRDALLQTESSTPESGPATQFDRDRTRLLAQAMAVKLEREREQTPRTSASVVANANAAATAVAAARSERDGGASVQAKAPAASAAATQSPTPGVAQRFLLVPAGGDDRRGAERAGLAQRVVAAPPAPPAPPVAHRSESPVVASTPSAPIGLRRVESVAAPRLAPMAQPPAQPVAPVAPAAAAKAPSTAVPEGIDLVDIDRLVSEVLRRPTSRVAARPEKLEALYANLLSQEIGNDLADAIITDLHASLTAEELASDHAVRSAAMQRIATLLPAGGGLEPAPGAQGWRRDGRALCVAFVGPTGVGKTTTVAKIAASLKLRYGARVGLITCDTYRIAAVDQLRTYAEIIGLPLEVALSPGQMRQARQRLNDLDVVLIDTAGRSQNDADRIGELAAMVKAAEPHETHLVLSSVASEKVLLREAQAFSTVGVQRVVLTKLDEAVGLGTVLRVVRQIGRGVSYITTGQEVPQHLESARPTRLAELVLGGAPSA